MSTVTPNKVMNGPAQSGMKDVEMAGQTNIKVVVNNNTVVTTPGKKSCCKRFWWVFLLLAIAVGVGAGVGLGGGGPPPYVCEDTPNWVNFPQAPESGRWTCAQYVTGNACGGELQTLIITKWGGAFYGYPERNCCACGKKAWDNRPPPPPPASVTPKPTAPAVAPTPTPPPAPKPEPVVEKYPEIKATCRFSFDWADTSQWCCQSDGCGGRKRSDFVCDRSSIPYFGKGKQGSRRGYCVNPEKIAAEKRAKEEKARLAAEAEKARLAKIAAEQEKARLAALAAEAEKARLEAEAEKKRLAEEAEAARKAAEKEAAEALARGNDGDKYGLGPIKFYESKGIIY